nr:MAG TPA: hypothetical protein [Caudoviricetes sp.]
MLHSLYYLLYDNISVTYVDYFFKSLKGLFFIFLTIYVNLYFVRQ